MEMVECIVQTFPFSGDTIGYSLERCMQLKDCFILLEALTMLRSR